MSTGAISWDGSSLLEAGAINWDGSSLLEAGAINWDGSSLLEAGAISWDGSSLLEAGAISWDGSFDAKAQRRYQENRPNDAPPLLLSPKKFISCFGQAKLVKNPDTRSATSSRLLTIYLQPE